MLEIPTDIDSYNEDTIQVYEICYIIVILQNFYLFKL